MDIASPLELYIVPKPYTSRGSANLTARWLPVSKPIPNVWAETVSEGHSNTALFVERRFPGINEVSAYRTDEVSVSKGY